MTDLLIELGCEDLPAGSAVPMAEHLARALYSALEAAGLSGGEPTWFCTPRRIAAIWPDVGERQADQVVERRGPALDKAYADGEPTKALTGFLAGAKATVEDLGTLETDKGAWVVLKQTRPGQSLDDVVQGAIGDIMKTMPSPRRMRWADQPHEFLRPVVWLLALYGPRVLPVSVLGLESGGESRGHRFHAPDPLPVANPDVYVATLEKASVLADYADRRARIKTAVDAEAQRLGGTPVVDAELLDEVTSLVEWPVVVAGQFDPEFLEIPKEALIQTMQENQRYFALLDDTGRLLPAFITVANIASNNVQTVIDGNERVIRPRFADTMFFWQQDKQRTLQDRVPDLDRLLFQKTLGSVGDKVRRMQTVSAWLSGPLEASESECVTAAMLCKADLTSEIVKELAKMQGIAGRYYAEREGLSQSVSDAVEQHYWPKQAGGKLPEAPVAQVVALADRVDTLVGIYGQGLKPTGAKDPFGLRRAALGVVRILIEKQHDLELRALFEQSLQSFGDRLPDADLDELLAYVLERLRGYAIDQGYGNDVVDAVLAKGSANPLDILARLRAIRDFRSTEASVSLAAAAKRIGNILRKNEIDSHATVDDTLLSEPAEQALAKALNDSRSTINAQLEARNYGDAMLGTAALREPVDRFFDDVMVMSDDLAVRNNRLALLQEVNALCSSTADLSRLQPQET